MFDFEKNDRFRPEGPIGGNIPSTFARELSIPATGNRPFGMLNLSVVNAVSVFNEKIGNLAISSSKAKQAKVLGKPAHQILGMVQKTFTPTTIATRQRAILNYAKSCIHPA
jgi:hypothetical protein